MKLWDEDMFPACEQCLDGNHEACQDLFFYGEYGLLACGCENIVHALDTDGTVW